MALGLGHLRLDPHAFWSMTIPEFTAAARAVLPRRQPSTVPTRTTLQALMAQFPDNRE